MSSPQHRGTRRASIPPNSTPFPNRLLDIDMPKLRDTEWRVLCVVVRQTLGWSRDGARRQSDWMTQRQLKRKTGRHSEAVSKAIDALVKAGYIETRDEMGGMLLSSSERRRYTGRVYFRIAPSLLVCT